MTVHEGGTYHDTRPHDPCGPKDAVLGPFRRNPTRLSRGHRDNRYPCDTVPLEGFVASLFVQPKQSVEEVECHRFYTAGLCPDGRTHWTLGVVTGPEQSPPTPLHPPTPSRRVDPVLVARRTTTSAVSVSEESPPVVRPLVLSRGGKPLPGGVRVRTGGVEVIGAVEEVVMGCMEGERRDGTSCSRPDGRLGGLCVYVRCGTCVRCGACVREVWCVRA